MSQHDTIPLYDSRDLVHGYWYPTVRGHDYETTHATVLTIECQLIMSFTGIPSDRRQFPIIDAISSLLC